MLRASSEKIKQLGGNNESCDEVLETMGRGGGKGVWCQHQILVFRLLSVAPRRGTVDAPWYAHNQQAARLDSIHGPSQ